MVTVIVRNEATHWPAMIQLSLEQEQSKKLLIQFVPEGAISLPKSQDHYNG